MKGDLSANVKLAEEFLEISQRLLQEDRHDPLLLHMEHCCRLIFLKAVKIEQVMLQQRATIQWMKDGDQCSRVFFRMVAIRRANKRIFQISDEAGNTFMEQNEISNVFVAYYQRLLGGDRTDRATDLRYLRPWARHIITDEEASLLIRPITKDDVETVVFDIEEDRAPGPNGYSSGFFKAAWPVVGEENNVAVMDFFTTGRLLKQVNATLITLIPKVCAPSLVVDFRPISCCNVIYKIITKILVLRIRGVLDKLISPSQIAFVLGRSISDNVLLAQELCSGYNQCRLPPRCALKVDLRKAYDTVEWDFLLATLQLFEFPPTFNRELRQGDPVSPYLFVLVMELSFADDLILLCKAEVRSVDLFRRRTPTIEVSWSSTYRLSLDHVRLSASIAKIDARIRGWDGVGLSFAGRVQLIKSVLLAFEVYWAMAFLLPKGVIKEIVKRIRTFLWKGNSSSGYLKVAWDSVCKPIEEGGQGIRDILALNRALMNRRLWSVIKYEKESIWVEWIAHYRLRDASIWTVNVKRGA
ncbi:Transposon TX1 uncharacterized protein [Sesamum angolense]|uniref:Transposon TX1 uncharacterized protein n=1 Tax=Sesamum angolense TaxID=2727404 RepID=A0AAE1T8T1_9LAMI|nr:Transposon TX1 uncharacterized protein [Sesamum angolense]